MIKLTTWFPGSLVLLALVAGCGSDSGSGSGSNGQPSTADVVSSCNTTCNKEKSCNPSLANFFDCSKICDPSTFTGGTGTGGSSSTTVTCDYGALKAALDHCATVDCSELTSCEEQATSLCKSTSSGTGGTSGVGAGGGTAEGSGGSATGAGATTGTSTGGSGTGTGTCAPCGGKAAACCPAYYTKLGQPTTACSLFTEASCESQAASNQTTIAQGCSALLTGGAAQNVPECM